MSPQHNPVDEDEKESRSPEHSQADRHSDSRSDDRASHRASDRDEHGKDEHAAPEITPPPKLQA